MPPCVHVVRDVVDEDASEPSGTEYDHVIQALTSDRADEALDVGVLLRRSRCRDDLMDLHRADRRRDVREYGIAIVQQVPRRVILAEGVPELLGRPCGRGDGQ